MTEQLEALQSANNDAADALHDRGDELVVHFQDVPTRAREVTLHGVRRGAAVALVVAQVHSGCDLRPLQPDFLNGEDVDDHQELVIEFEGAADAVAHITPVEGVMNRILLGH